MATITPEQIRSDFDTNTLGPLILYQAFAKLLAASDVAGGSKFVVVSSLLGQIAESLPFPYNAYGLSKAAVNFVVKKIDQEDSAVTAFPMQCVDSLSLFLIVSLSLLFPFPFSLPFCLSASATVSSLSTPLSLDPSLPSPYPALPSSPTIAPTLTPPQPRNGRYRHGPHRRRRNGLNRRSHGRHLDSRERQRSPRRHRQGHQRDARREILELYRTRNDLLG
jgi:hypothetical protein